MNHRPYPPCRTNIIPVHLTNGDPKAAEKGVADLRHTFVPRLVRLPCTTGRPEAIYQCPLTHPQTGFKGGCSAVSNIRVMRLLQCAKALFRPFIDLLAATPTAILPNHYFLSPIGFTRSYKIKTGCDPPLCCGATHSVTVFATTV